MLIMLDETVNKRSSRATKLSYQLLLASQCYVDTFINLETCTPNILFISINR